MGKERDAAWYNDKFSSWAHTDAPAEEVHYNPIWRMIADDVAHYSSVLDLGCGCGHFAEALEAAGFKGTYTGIDFSSTAIAACMKRKVPFRCDYLCEDLKTVGFPDSAAVVSIETLEHIEDLSFLKRLTGKPIYFTVPDNDSDGHVRFFKTGEEAAEYFSQFMEVKEVRPYKDPHSGWTFWYIQGVLC